MAREKKKPSTFGPKYTHKMKTFTYNEVSPKSEINEAKCYGVVTDSYTTTSFLE